MYRYVNVTDSACHEQICKYEGQCIDQVWKCEGNVVIRYVMYGTVHAVVRYVM